MAWTYFSPELTLKEMELVENKDEAYMRSFKLLNNADVNETEMRLSSSSSKFLSAYCRRKTIAIDCDGDHESNSFNKEKIKPTMELNSEIQQNQSKVKVGQKRKLFEETTASIAQPSSIPPAKIRQNRSKVHVGQNQPSEPGWRSEVNNDERDYLGRFPFFTAI